MCKLTTEVTAYKDCRGDLHATKLEALATSAAILASKGSYSSISSWDARTLMDQIVNNDTLRKTFVEVLKEKDEERTKELTRAFCEASKTC